MKIKVQGTASDIKRIWVVKWYKPWTWLRRGWSMYNVEPTSMKISIDRLEPNESIILYSIRNHSKE